VKGRFEGVGSYPETQQVLGALIRGRPKAAAGSKEVTGERSGVPRSGRACRLEGELNRSIFSLITLLALTFATPAYAFDSSASSIKKHAVHDYLNSGSLTGRLFAPRDRL
jgi:hypothetical protein